MNERPASPSLIVVCGLRAEARIARRAGVHVIAGGGDSDWLESEIARAIAEGANVLLSFGLAAALVPALAPGTLVLADAVIDAGARIATDHACTQRLRLLVPRAVAGDVAGVPVAVASPAAKRSLQAASGAVAADMESHLVARAARPAGLPFAVLRAIADPLHRSVPSSALAGMGAGGRADPLATLRALARHPAELPALLRVAIDAWRGLNALRQCRI